MTPYQALEETRDAIALELGHTPVPAIVPLEERETIAGARECFAPIIGISIGAATGGTELRVRFGAYYAMHYAIPKTAIAYKQVYEDALSIAKALNKLERDGYSSAGVIRIAMPSGEDGVEPIRMFLNPVPRNGGVLTVEASFDIIVDTPA